MDPTAVAAKPMKIASSGFSSRVPTTLIAHSVPTGFHRDGAPKKPSTRPRTPSMEPPEFLLPPSPPVFSRVPTANKTKDDKSYRLAYISSSCPDVGNFVPSFGPVVEGARRTNVPRPVGVAPGSMLQNAVPLGSSPTIISVLQTTPEHRTLDSVATSVGRGLFGVSGAPLTSPPTTIGNGNNLDISASPLPVGGQLDDDDMLMFGPLSLGPESEFLGLGASLDTTDQLSNLYL